MFNRSMFVRESVISQVQPCKGVYYLSYNLLLVFSNRFQGHDRERSRHWNPFSKPE